MGLLGVIVAFASLCAALIIVVLTVWGSKDVALLLPGVSKIPLPATVPLLAILFCGILVGSALRQWSDQNPPRLTIVALCAIFFLGGAAIVEAAVGSDATVLKATLLLLLGALVVEATHAEMRRFRVQPPPLWRAQLWIAVGITLAFGVPALLGDPAPVWSGLAICLVAGAIATIVIAVWALQKGKWIAHWSRWAIFFLGAATVAEAAVRSDPTVLKATILLFVGAIVVEATRAETERLNVPDRQRSWRRQPLWLVGGVILAFAIPALLGDSTPVRSGLAIGLRVGALVAALAAARAIRKADGLEITTWAGGLGGGRSGFRLSRATGMFLLALALAGATGAIMSQRPATTGQTEDRAPMREGAGKSEKKAEKPPDAKSDKKD